MIPAEETHRIQVTANYTETANRIFSNGIDKSQGSFARTVNVLWPTPTTILELVNIVKGRIVEHSSGRITPEIRVIDTGELDLYGENDRQRIRVDISRAKDFLGLRDFRSVEQSIDEIVKRKIQN